MSYVNKVILIGNLGKDPEIRNLSNNNVVVNTILLTKEFWKDKDDNKKESVEWHRVIFYNNLAKIVSKYLKKGSKIYIEGKIKNRKWLQDNEEKYITEIICSNMQMLSYNKKYDNEEYNLNEKKYFKSNNYDIKSKENKEFIKKDKYENIEDKKYKYFENNKDNKNEIKKNNENNENNDIKKYLKDLDNDDIPF
ncbi:single-strand binding protein [Candidatus Zinderia insecticola CARI]|uniref:Single-stranded DNA-binding protein n=1 Tax=Zinderia insecticola (strain CARI) TaxID=871271 RepID=E0TIQ6_ZINIC|nr:single-strand binding protein [Candidatus Zinderia insecticola CARI]